MYIAAILDARCVTLSECFLQTLENMYRLRYGLPLILGLTTLVNFEMMGLVNSFSTALFVSTATG